MPTYVAGAVVERLYPGPNAEAARAAAQPQIDAFLAAGFMIAGERWLDDSTSGGAPVGDAVATGTISYLAGKGGRLAISYQASQPADLPPMLPAYTLEDPRTARLRAWSQVQVAFGTVFVIAFLIVFLIAFLVILDQITSSHSGMAPFGP